MRSILSLPYENREGKAWPETAPGRMMVEDHANSWVFVRRFRAR